MLDWYFGVNQLLREMRRKATDALGRLGGEDAVGAELIKGYLKSDFQLLVRQWESQGLQRGALGDLGRHISFGMVNDYENILERDLQVVEVAAEKHVRASELVAPKVGFENLLHPIIHAHSFNHYTNGHFREAVLNSIVAIFDLIRHRTGLDLDGNALVTQVLSLERPRLILSELDSESGRNDQKGFMQILSGAFLGIRNPKAHSLGHDLDAEKTAQYLIFASLLARRVEHAKHVPIL